MGIHRWELETLLVQLFLTPKDPVRPEGNLILDCTKFDSMLGAINRLRSLENVESASYLNGNNVFSEMHRIAQRQFHWQHGYFNLSQFYRYIFVYGQGQCADYFEQQYGLKITEFALAAFTYFGAYQRTPWLAATPVPGIGLTQEILDCALPMLSISLDDARARTTQDTQLINEQHGSRVPTAYLPSALRRSPLIWPMDRPDRFIAPIPEIIIMRATSGLYYDLVGGGQALLNEANERFEEYSAQYLSTMMPRFTVDRAFRYGPKGGQYDSPDIIVKDGDEVVLAVECKATKLTYLAQFAEDPFESQRRQYQQLSRGIFQLWRYFSHIRRGILPLELADETHAMLLTLDPFARMHRELRTNIMDEARRLADEDGNISGEDRRHVIICPILELEQILHTSHEDTFLASLNLAKDERYIDWGFREVHRESEATRNFGESRPFPFDLGDLVPWWNPMLERMDEWAEAQIANAQD